MGMDNGHERTISAEGRKRLSFFAKRRNRNSKGELQPGSIASPKVPTASPNSESQSKGKVSREEAEYNALEAKFNALVRDANNLLSQRRKEAPNEVQWHVMTRDHMVQKAQEACFGLRAYNHPIVSGLSYQEAKEAGRL